MSPSPRCADHTPAPPGYLAWHEWAERMSATHEQRRCPGCGLFAVWVAKEGHPDAKPIDPADVGGSCRAVRLNI